MKIVKKPAHVSFISMDRLFFLIASHGSLSEGLRQMQCCPLWFQTTFRAVCFVEPTGIFLDRIIALLPDICRKAGLLSLFQHRIQIPGGSAVLQDKAGDTDAALFTDVGVGGAVLPQTEVDLQVGKAGGEILELNFRFCLAEAVEGI